MASVVIARLSIEKPGALSAEDLAAVIAWLKGQAKNLGANAKDYTNTGPYRARLSVRPGA